jgi:glycerol uptake facilitator protein
MVNKNREVWAPTLKQKCLAEFLGTAFLVYVGAGTLTASSYLEHSKGAYTMADLVAVSLAFGLAIAVMIYAIGHISGCHINPAISIALASIRRISWSQTGFYVLAQLLGSLLGGFLIALTFGRDAASLIGYGPTDFNKVFVNPFSATVVEAIATFFLLFVVMGTVIDRRSPSGWSGFAVGLTITAEILLLATVTGGCMNPARTFGPALVQVLFGGSYPIAHLLIYFIGPIVGSVGGVFAYEYLALRRPATDAARRGFEAGD